MTTGDLLVLPLVVRLGSELVDAGFEREGKTLRVTGLVHGNGVTTLTLDRRCAP